MIRYALLAAALCSALAAEPRPNTLTDQEKQEGWRLLFDGETLDGWKGDSRLWSVEDGAIAGSTEGVELDDNSFLISEEEYSDFVLQAEVKLRNHNSGIQFRSEELPDYVVRGYQAGLAEGNWWGSLYGEKTGRHVIANGWKGKGETVVKPGGWNHYEIRCEGERITLKLNGLVTVDLEDGMASKGVIALQLHRGPPMKVWFRNIKLKTLN